MASHPIPLFWRLFIPNATVLSVACVVLILEPANGRIPALVGGLAAMLAVNLLLMRRAVRPLTRLTALMRRVDPLHPGERIPLLGPSSEVTVLVEAFNDMLDRLEAERRESGLRALNEREGERRRLAGELHDQIGQTLTAAALQVQRLADRATDDVRDEAIAVRETISVALRCTGRTVRLEVRDDGRGIIGAGGDGSGLRTMRERALTIGADLEVAASDGRGTAVRLAVDAEDA